MFKEPPDPTMRSLLAVHRAEVNDLDAQLESMTYDRNRLRDEAIQLRSDNSRLKNDVERIRGTSNERQAHVEKLQGVIDSLQLELAAEREAHTKLRDETRPAKEGA